MRESCHLQWAKDMALVTKGKCERLSAELIEQMKAEIAAEKTDKEGSQSRQKTSGPRNIRSEGLLFLSVVKVLTAYCCVSKK